MKQSEKFQRGRENPKQASTHLALALQLKQGWGYPKRWSDFPLHKSRAKILRCCNFEEP
jgi:hypothetical protein